MRAAEMRGAYRTVTAILARVRPSLRGGLGVRLGLVIGLAALSGATAGLMPAIMGVAIDALLGRAARPPGGAASAFSAVIALAPGWAVIPAAALAALATVAVAVGSSRRGSELSGEITAALRIEMLRAVLHASPHDVDEAGRASLGARPPGPAGAAPPGAKAPPAVRGTEIVKLAVARESAMAAELVVALLTGLPQAAVTLSVLAWELVSGGAPVVLAGAALLFALSRLAADRASRRVGVAMARMQEADAAIFSGLGEMLAATEDLRLLGARGDAVREFAAAAYGAADARRRFAGALAVSGQIKSVFSAVSPLLLLVALQLGGRARDPGEVAKLLLVIPLVMARLEALDALRGAMVEREPLLAATTRLLALPSAPVAAPDAVGVEALGPGAIAFEEVRFTPKGAPRAVLDGLTLAIPAGAVVGICGRSGSGKSTLLRVLLRLDEVDAGAIRVDGVDVRRIAPEALPRVFAVLGQASRLLERSVAENLALGMATQPAPAEMEEALRRVELDALITGGGRGLATEVRAVPPNFSGGEQRRLLLARMLLRDARVLVIDEPEAGLPSATAEAILKRVAEVAGGRTTLVVTHAPHLLRSAFNVVLDAGKVAAVGTHAELVEGSEIYRSLLAEGLRRAPAG
jgi:ABC-type multidrug transport system fused ATPase/permease subunit